MSGNLEEEIVRMLSPKIKSVLVPGRFGTRIITNDYYQS